MITRVGLNEPHGYCFTSMIKQFSLKISKFTASISWGYNLGMVISE